MILEIFFLLFSGAGFLRGIAGGSKQSIAVTYIHAVKNVWIALVSGI